MKGKGVGGVEEEGKWKRGVGWGGKRINLNAILMILAWFIISLFFLSLMSFEFYTSQKDDEHMNTGR